MITFPSFVQPNEVVKLLGSIIDQPIKIEKIQLYNNCINLMIVVALVSFHLCQKETLHK